MMGIEMESIIYRSVKGIKEGQSESKTMLAFRLKHIFDKSRREEQHCLCGRVESQCSLWSSS